MNAQTILKNIAKVAAKVGLAVLHLAIALSNDKEVVTTIATIAGHPEIAPVINTVDSVVAKVASDVKQ